MGIAFQKLNGGQTTANKSLEKLEDIDKQIIEQNKKLDDLKDLTVKPEIWRLAKLYSPDLDLEPVQFAGSLKNNNSGNSVVFTRDDKMYYGRLQIQLSISDGNKGGARHIANFIIVKGGEQQANYEHGYKGKTDWNVTTGSYEFIGFFDQLILRKFFSHKYEARVNFEFQGFVLGEKKGAFIEPYTDKEPVEFFTNDDVALLNFQEISEGYLEPDSMITSEYDFLIMPSRESAVYDPESLQYKLVLSKEYPSKIEIKFKKIVIKMETEAEKNMTIMFYNGSKKMSNYKREVFADGIIKISYLHQHVASYNIELRGETNILYSDIRLYDSSESLDSGHYLLHNVSRLLKDDRSREIAELEIFASY